MREKTVHQLLILFQVLTVPQSGLFFNGGTVSFQKEIPTPSVNTFHHGPYVSCARSNGGKETDVRLSVMRSESDVSKNGYRMTFQRDSHMLVVLDPGL